MKINILFLSFVAVCFVYSADHNIIPVELKVLTENMKFHYFDTYPNERGSISYLKVAWKGDKDAPSVFYLKVSGFQELINPQDKAKFTPQAEQLLKCDAAVRYALRGTNEITTDSLDNLLSEEQKKQYNITDILASKKNVFDNYTSKEKYLGIAKCLFASGTIGICVSMVAYIFQYFSNVQCTDIIGTGFVLGAICGVGAAISYATYKSAFNKCLHVSNQLSELRSVLVKKLFVTKDYNDILLRDNILRYDPTRIKESWFKMPRKSNIYDGMTLE